MSNERNSHRTPIVPFAIAVTIAILAAFVATFERIDTRTPLDRAPGQPVLGN